MPVKKKIKKKNLKCATLEKKNGEKYTTCYDAKKAKKAKPKKRRRSTPYLPNDDTDDEEVVKKVPKIRIKKPTVKPNKPIIWKGKTLFSGKMQKGIDLSPGQIIGTFKGKTIYKPINKKQYGKYEDNEMRENDSSNFIPEGMDKYTKKGRAYVKKHYPDGFPRYPDLHGTDLSFNIPDDWEEYEDETPGMLQAVANLQAYTDSAKQKALIEGYMNA